MKLSKEELAQKINGLDIDDEIKITLLEDITDSMEIAEPDNSELEEIKTKYEELKEIKTKYEELKEKYKERFLKGSDESEKEEEKEDDEELKEEEVIDVKEI